MPLGPFGEVLGTTGTFQSLGPGVPNYKTNVVAPRNPKLVKQNEPEMYKMTPSKFLFEMSLTTEQKLANTHIMKIPRKIDLLDMGDTSLQKFSRVNIDEPMFQPFPSEIYFQNFKPFELYEVPLLLRNNDKVPRLIKVTHDNSPYFKVISPPDVGHKVGPGLPTIFRVQFKPEESRDYKHELICITEREKFVVPVWAIGSRGILDFPDQIFFSSGFVKYPNSKTILVRNIGSREAKFTLKVKPPFYVSPEIGTLGVNESMQLTIEFKPTRAGDHKGNISLYYDTGEEISIGLYGVAQDANIRLDKNSIRIENTYISMANQRTVTISNHSDIIVHFRWSKFSSSDDEEQLKLLQQIELDREENNDTDKFLEECGLDPMLRDKLSILSRTFQNRKRAVENDLLQFNDDIISILPVEGDIWPNSTQEVMVVFKPREATTYTRTAYCDISGRESRLPLRVRGDGIGPKVDFSFVNLDMGNIFIGLHHTYEIVLANKGDIDVIYSIIPNSSIFGPCFSFNPTEGIVMPGGYQAIHVAFSSPYLGEFEEVFCFQVDGQPQQYPVTFSGRVVGPTFNFDVAELKFGTVSFGFLTSQTCYLVNTSLVPLVFNLRVPGDGSNKSVCCQDDVRQSPLSPGTQPTSDPREFEVIPSSGMIPPQSKIKVTVNLVPNTLRKFEMALVVDVERVGEEIISLPISAVSSVPEIKNLTPILNYGRCFMRHPYKRMISLQNNSALPAKYELMTQSPHGQNQPAITYHSPQPKGIIPPNSAIEVPLIIEAQILGEQESVCSIAIFGSETTLDIDIICVGEGPVIHINPLFIDWGEIAVLVDHERTINLSNESFIPAYFEAFMLGSNTVFKVSPSKGEIAPEESVLLKVKVNLDDCLRFQEKLTISVKDSQSRQINLIATGKGTTIVSDPFLAPVIDFGPHFSNRLFQKKFKLTNKGRRFQQLVWTTEGFLSKVRKEKSKIYSPAHKNKQADSSTEDLAVSPVFRLLPNRLELNPGESKDLTIEGFMTQPQTVSETVVCQAIIGRAGGKIPIITTTLRADFIEPLLNFSTKCAFFRVDKTANEEMKTQQKQLDMSNLSSLPLTVGLKLAYPFSLVVDGESFYETTVCLQSGEVYNLVIEFDPYFKDDSHIRMIDEVLYITYKEHPHVDYVALRGEVYFPNLEFEKTTVDFGCILNDMEVTRYVNLTNISPMQVCYHWTFMVGGDAPTLVKKVRRRKISTVSDGLSQISSQPSAQEVGMEEDKEPHVVETTELDVEEDKDAEKDMEAPSKSLSEIEREEVKKASVDLDPNRDVQENKTLLFSEGEEAPEKGQLEQEEKPESEKETRTASSEYSFLNLDVDKECPGHNKALLSLLEDDAVEEEEEEDIAIGLQEVFDILPLYGCLEPGETDQVTFTFYGHANISAEAYANCRVEDGPTYKVKLVGAASLVEYSFSSLEIDYGKQMYNQVAKATITLFNKGKVGFEFTALDVEPASSDQPLPGCPIMTPHSGYIEALAEQEIEVQFLPGLPDSFRKTFQIQVAHFKPDTITVVGEGVFPRVLLDLPRQADNDGYYDNLVKEARENLVRIFKEKKEKDINRSTEKLKVQIGQQEGEDENPANEQAAAVIEEVQVQEPTEIEIQMEAERIAVRDFVLQHQNNTEIFSYNQQEGEVQHVLSNTTMALEELKRIQPVLPEYLLDFGYVVLGTVRTHVIRATNMGWLPVSFKLDRSDMDHSGFHTGLDRVRNLPGAPDNETLDFVISFDPRGANLYLGPVELVIPIYIVKGPKLNLRLRAHVTMPDMKVSHDVLDFREVKCGECQIITVQLHNHQQVKCEWDASPPDDHKKIDKHVPMHLRRKMNRQLKKTPNIFEVLPPTGILLPGQRINVQIKFMPTEERLYENRIQFRIAQSSQRVTVLCRGSGLEPRLEFGSTLMQFDPVLPHSVGTEAEVLVFNPCTFPIEFYSLESDNKYLHEEKVLRLMRGYDVYNTLLLPPRQVQDQLPHELLNYYQEQYKIVEMEEKARVEAEARLEAERRERELLEQAALINQLSREEPEDLAVRQTAEWLQKTVKDEKSPANVTSKKKLPKNVELNKNNSLLSEMEESLAASEEGNEEDGELPPEFVSKSQSEMSGAALSSVEEPSTEIPSPPQPKMESSSAEDLMARVENLLEERMKTSATSGAGVGELEMTPVSAAIARYLGVDLSSEGAAARNRRGIAIIVHGAPLSGKTSTAVSLAKHYEAALLSVDSIVCDAISSGNSIAGLKARELCAQAAKIWADSQPDTQEGDKKVDGLSVEAVAAHTQGGMAGSLRKHSALPDQKSKLTATGKNTQVTSSGEAATTTQALSSPPLVAGPNARRLSISASVAGENGLMSCVLPEDVLVEILAERLQLNDCYRGVVFDGLDTLFSSSYVATAWAILKALNNRRFIYFITLKLDYQTLKDQEETAKSLAELERLHKEKEEIKWLEEMDEDEYDSLPSEVKLEVDRKLLHLKKERMIREKEKAEREKQEKAAREEEERRKEEERLKAKGRRNKGLALLDPKDKKHQSAAKNPPETPKKPSGKGQEERPESHATVQSEQHPPEDKKKKSKHAKQNVEVPPTVEEPKDPAREAELLLMQRFRVFEAAQKDIQDLLDFWDRSTLLPRSPITPSERSEEEQKDVKSRRSKDKEEHGISQGNDKHKEKESERLRIEKEQAEKAKLTSDEGEAGETEEDKKDEWGVPHIVVDTANKTFIQPVKPVKSDALSVVEESQQVLDTKQVHKNKSANRNSIRRNLKKNNSTSNHNINFNAVISKSGSLSVDNHVNEGQMFPFDPEESVNPYINMSLVEMILASEKLPSISTVSDGIGLGPQGPAIPPPVTFSVVPYPVKRKQPSVLTSGGHFIFVASSPEDPNLGVAVKEPEHKVKEEDLGKSGKAADKVVSPVTESRRGRGSDRGEISQDGKVDKHSADRKQKIARRSSSQTHSPQPGQSTTTNTEVESQLAASSFIEEEPKVLSAPLTIFRWAVPPGESVIIRLRFTSSQLGQFDQTLNFELVGTRRRYQLFCRGVCAFPTISKEPRVVFPSRKKSRHTAEIVHKKFILQTETFEFGPLLAAKSRDRYRERKYSENMESFNIVNTSPMDADVSFCFLRDSTGETFLLEPPTMLLKPGQSGKLAVWAYPKGPGSYNDTVVCCMHENPEPVVFKVCCQAFKPELKLDKQVLQFDKILLHRKDTKTIQLSNPTQLPVAWKLSGLETLGDDFNLAADCGIVEPQSEFILYAYFRAMKATQTEKTIRMEISDADNILGVMQTEPIQIIAEAYDVALDMSFPRDVAQTSTKKGHKVSNAKEIPADDKKQKARQGASVYHRLSPPTFSLASSKGTDGGLDFGAVRVNEDARQFCTLKNKGGYEIAFKFVLENVSPKKLDVTSLFSVSPSSGKLLPTDKPTQVQVIFKSSHEVSIKDLPLLKCQVIEPTLGDQGEMIASIPVRVSVRAIFSKYVITPSQDINFGALLVGSKKTRTLTIENNGDFDFRFTITKKDSDMASTSRGVIKQDRAIKPREDTTSAAANKSRRQESISGRNKNSNMMAAGKQENLSKLQLGMFSIFPSLGIILPKGNQVVTIDCVGEMPGQSLEDVCIDITDRDQSTSPGGIPYRFMAEACIPGINVEDVGSIFEEHRVCKNLALWQHTNMGQSEVGGIYGIEEKKFVFNNVIVGRPAKARFKISNPNKVPCDVILTLKPNQPRGAPKSSDVFDLDPPRMQILNNSHVYVTVTFTPASMQTYSATFEATVEGSFPGQQKGKSLTFEVSGEGNLPRITIAKPAVRNKRGQPLALFKRTLVGRTESRPLELVNEGTLPSKVNVDLLDSDGCFILKPTVRTQSPLADKDYSEAEMRKGPHTASVIVNSGDTATLEVIYRPVAPLRSQGSLKVTVMDNQYEDYIIQMVGEGFEDDITLDNIGSVLTFTNEEEEYTSLADEDAPAVCGVQKTGSLAHIESLHEFLSDHGEEDSASQVHVPKTPIRSLTLHDGTNNCLKAADANIMQFGDCYLNEGRTLTLTMTNHSKSDCIRFQWPDHPHLKFSPQVGHLHSSCTKDVAITFTASEQQTYCKCPVLCQVVKIVFDKPIDQVCDWDDQQQVVKWVDPAPPPTAQSQGRDLEEEGALNLDQQHKGASLQEMLEVLLAGNKSPAIKSPITRQPGKRKVIEVEPEPQFTEVQDSCRSIELLVSAVADSAKCVCDVNSIHFKDTLMFQTRVYSVTLENYGLVSLDYHWQVAMKSQVISRPGSRSVTPQIIPQTTSSDPAFPQADVVDPSNMPFLVDPVFGTIQPGKTVQCVVKFAPLDANEFEGKLICSVPHLSSTDQCPVIHLKGRSLVPFCHFELEDSDYLSNARRNPELPGPRGSPPGSALDPNTRVLEFQARGVAVRCYKEFGIINPTSKPYKFEWVCEDERDSKQPMRFNCLHKQGEIESGMKVRVGFEFISRELDVAESFWRFVIPSESVSLPFLLVGHAQDPDVCLDRSHLSFRSLLIGQEASETVYIYNHENSWVNFCFDESSCHSEGYASHLIVEPLQGQVPSKSSLPIKITFTPSSDKEVNFNLRCTVAHKVAPLTLNVKAVGFSMSSALYFEDASGARLELSDKEPNQINLGEVEINETIIKHFLLLNTGKFNFDYLWEVDGAQPGASALSMAPQRGGVLNGQNQQFSLTFCPSRHLAFNNFQMSLKVVNGRTYQILLSGLAVNVGLHFSFLAYNFGNCFIQKPGLDLPPKQTVLKITNKDRKDVSVSCLYEPTSHLTHKFEGSVIPPNKSVQVTFTFFPRQAIKYQEVVLFEINGVSRQKVEFTGTGCEMKIEVVDPKHRCVNLGARLLGDNVRKFIPIVNNSPVPITLTLAFMPSEPALQNKEVLSITPREPITLVARGGTAKIEVWFRPKARIPQFTEEVLLECAGISQPLFVLKGSCLGMEVKLDSEAVSFGTVFQRSCSSRKLVMSNTGDMNTKFRWDIKRFKPDFSISPVEGYITSGMDVTFQVDFHPQSINADVRYEKLKCFLEGGPQKPLTLTLTGSCTGIPPVEEVQTFQAIVRQSDTRQIMIPNKTNQLWHLRPIIDGEYWTGPVTFTVEPQQTWGYELTYRPLTMTSDNKKHVGSIFFPLPDGSGLLFNLSGNADPPRVAGKIQRDVPCKTSYTELLSVSNWLPKQQRFRVKIESLKEKLDLGTTVKGVEYIDVPADGRKDYKVSFYAFKEGVTSVKVTFINEHTGEFQFYEVTFGATRPGTIATIELSTPVRQTVHHVVKVENPLPGQVNFQISCSVTEVLLPNQFSLPAQSQGQFNFEYQPLKVGVVTGRLELNSSELGSYIYELVLTATPAAPEKAIYFRTSLGSNVTQVARFLNFAKQKVDYSCRIENPDFRVDKLVPAAPASTGGTEVAMDVFFEPSVLGEQRALLQVTSSLGGDYQIPLFGTCDPPRPQGPFTIKAGSNVPIIFKNVFKTATQFTFQVDNPQFHLTKYSESIGPQKEHRIVVSFDSSDVRSKAAVMAKLVVSCAYSAGGTSYVQWVYYLKGLS